MTAGQKVSTMSIAQRRAKEKNKRMADIQKAARKVFWKKGYHDTTVEEIARKAQVSKGTVYFYFRSKDELYVSLMIPLIEQLRLLLEEFEKDLQGGRYKDGEEFTKGIVDLLIKLYQFDPEALNIFQIFQLESLFSLMSEPTKDRLKNLGRINFTILRRVIARSVDLGYFRPLDPVQLADLFWGSFLGIVQLEQTKFQLSKKNHLLGTLEFTVSALTKGLLKK